MYVFTRAAARGKMSSQTLSVAALVVAIQRASSWRHLSGLFMRAHDAARDAQRTRSARHSMRPNADLFAGTGHLLNALMDVSSLTANITVTQSGTYTASVPTMPRLVPLPRPPGTSRMCAWRGAQFHSACAGHAQRALCVVHIWQRGGVFHTGPTHLAPLHRTVGSLVRRAFRCRPPMRPVWRPIRRALVMAFACLIPSFRPLKRRPSS